MIREVFKICRVPLHTGDEPWIRSGWTRWKSMETDYSLAERTYPQLEGTPLFAYSTYEQACRYFSGQFSQRRVYRAKAEVWTGPKPGGIYSLAALGKHEVLDPRMTAQIVKELWTTGKWRYPDSRHWSGHKGTILCNWIELLEQLDQPPDILQEGDRPLWTSAIS